MLLKIGSLRALGRGIAGPEALLPEWANWRAAIDEFRNALLSPTPAINGSSLTSASGVTA